MFIPFVEPIAPRFELDKVAELQSLLSRLVQFGRPIETNLLNVITLNKTEFPITDTSEPRPAWKPTISVPVPAGSKLKNRVEVQLIETISSMQYDKSELTSDTWQISGKCLARVDMDFHPDMTVQFQRNQPTGPDITDARFHPCVESSNWTTFPLSTTFNPPLGQFIMCNYMVSNVPKLPIRGFYQLKDAGLTNVYKFLVQLKLSDALPNEFEYCDVELPFPTRKEIINADLTSSSGSAQIHPKKKNSILWSLGNKFSGKGLEVQLAGNVAFDGTTILSQNPEDNFFILPNACAELRFKLLNGNISGLFIDPKQIMISPKNSSPKTINVERYLISDKYIIWNSVGNVKFSASIDVLS